ncbi:MAG: hypothetical protein DRP76_05140, partial [Candidatus Omnitrophota bacterium]
VTPDLVEKGFSAQKFISQYKEKLNLKGGGKSHLSQGVIIKKIEDIVFYKTEIKESLKDFLKKCRS